MLTYSILILDFSSFQIVQDEPVFQEPAVEEENPGPAQPNEVNSESQFELVFLLDFCSIHVLTDSIILILDFSSFQIVQNKPLITDSVEGAWRHG